MPSAEAPAPVADVTGAAWRWPLMRNNVTRADLDTLVTYLSSDDPRLTNGPSVLAFEERWSRWVGTARSVMVNSGSSANDLAMLTLRHLRGEGHVVMSPLGWVSDVASVLHAGLTPVFVDIDLATLAPSASSLEGAVTDRARAVLLVHILGLNALTPEIESLLDAASGVELIEDVSESHGATAAGRKAGSIGWLSTFSFYYAHHLTTVEGGVICTGDENAYETLRMLRAHGLVREVSDPVLRREMTERHRDLNPDFVFAYPAHNMRPTEIQGVLGLSQLTRLDANNEERRKNFDAFLAGLDGETYFTDFALDGSCNYAFIVILREADLARRDRTEETMARAGIEFRRGLSGGGNQLRQPYARRLFPEVDPASFPNVEHVHNFGWYVGNFPGARPEEIAWLCDVLNSA